MIELRATTEDERDEFHKVLRSELIDQEQIAVVNLGLTWESHAELFRTAGEVHAVLADGDRAGFVWFDLRPPTLYVQSMILFAGARGQGIGRQVFRALESEYCDVANAMIVGALAESRQAIDFFLRIGFAPSDEETPPGFTNFRKSIVPGSP